MDTLCPCPGLKPLRRRAPRARRPHSFDPGVTAPVIALWLGHEEPATTHQYIEADLLSARVTPRGQMSHQLLDLQRVKAQEVYSSLSC